MSDEKHHGRWVIQVEHVMGTTPALIVPLVVVHCQLVDDGKVVAAFDMPLGLPAALELAGELIQATQIINLQARAQAGDEQAKAELEAKAQERDNKQLKRIYGFDEGDV